MFDQPHAARARGGRDPRGELRRPRLQDADPEDDPLRGGAREGHVRPQVRPDRERRGGVPRPGEGGSQWRESAQACVRARSRSSSGRPKPRSARRKNEPDGQPEPDAQARLEPLEETVEHAPPPVSRIRRGASPSASRAGAPTPQAGPARPVEELPRIEAAARACAAPAPRDALEPGAYAGRHPRRRSRRRGAERAQPDDRRGHLGGRVRRRQHGHPAARSSRTRRSKIHIGRELTQGLGSGADRRSRAPGGRGVLRPDQARAARLGHGLRHRGRGRRHRVGRRAGRRADRARARRAHGRHRHDAVPVRGHEAPRAGRRRRSRRCARAATR